MTLSQPARVLLWSMLILLALRCAAQAVVPLMPQEAYYWMYAQHPSLSYYDHPPMVAWVIGLGTTIFGNTEWGVRVVGGVMMLGAGVLMYAFARLWWRSSVALAATLLFELGPVYFGIGFLATMDAALLAFWLVALLGFSIAVRRGQVWGWYLCGFGFGGAMLSKYTGVFIAPGIALLLLWHRPWRRLLLTPHPYCGFLIGVMMFWPVVVWNWQHDWASFRFQFLSRFDDPVAARKRPFLEFVLQQIATATPIVLLAMGMVIWRGGRRVRFGVREKVALAFAVPLLLSMLPKAWTYPAHINWTAPAYLSFLPAAIQAARVRVRAVQNRPGWAWRRGVVLPTLVGSSAINIGLVLFLLVLQPKLHAFRVFGPWAEIAAVVEHYEDDLEHQTGREPLVIVDGKYELASLVAFYRNRTDPHDLPAIYTVNQVALNDKALGFAYWTDMARWRGTDCVFVDDDMDTEQRLRGKFKSVKVVWTGRAANGREYRITQCRDYLG